MQLGRQESEAAMSGWVEPLRREAQDMSRTPRKTVYPCLGGSGVAEAFLEKDDHEPGHPRPQGTGHEKPVCHLLS